MSREEHREDLLDLLAEKATTGLDAESQARLDQFLLEADEKGDHFELAAAALELAGPPFAEALPTGVEQRLRREARRFAAGLPQSNVKPFRPKVAAPAGPQAAPERAARPVLEAGGATADGPRAGGRSWLPWLMAALFCFAAITGWWRAFTLARLLEPSPSGPFASAGSAEPRDPAIARAALLEGKTRAVPVPWTLTQDPAAQGVTGDVVWSPENQQGFLRFQNLPGNDPKVFQYQLWIFDGTRDERFPIDGGVFDVPASGEVVIPITAKLPVREATIFAVTIEKPGGVVVSSRERIVVLAKLI